MKYSIVSLVLGTLLAASSLAQAQEQSPAPIRDTASPAGSAAVDDSKSKTVHQHDGFFLGIQLPVGFQNNILVDDTTISGASAGFTLQLGGAVAKDLIVYGELSGTSASNPSIRHREDTLETRNLSSDNFGFGPGLVYYIMPWNGYVGGSLLFSKFGLSGKDANGDSETIESSDMGIGAVARAGKEFWVSDNWALGLGLEARLATMKFLNEQMTTSSYSLTLNGTYN